MTKKPKADTEDDDLRPEYDFSKMKLIGRGIFAERYRAGTKVVLLDEGVESIDSKAFEDDDLRPEYEFKMRIVAGGAVKKRLLRKKGRKQTES